MANANTPPEDTIRDGSIKATIWRNESEKGPYYSTTLARTYEDRNGNLRDTHTFSSGDLLRVAEVARQAYHRSNELRRDYTQSREQDPTQEREPARGPSRNDAPDRGGDDRDQRREEFKRQREGGQNPGRDYEPRR